MGERLVFAVNSPEGGFVPVTQLKLRSSGVQLINPAIKLNKARLPALPYQHLYFHWPISVTQGL